MTLPFPFVALAMGLGGKHAYDADHLVAVGNILVGSNSLRKTATLVPFWLAGHQTTAITITLMIWFAKEAFLGNVLDRMDMIVAVLLLVLGAWRILAFVRRRWGHEHGHIHRLGRWSAEHAHLHIHLSRYKSHLGLYGIGLVQGLASNDEIFLLATTALAVTTLSGLLVGVAIFSIGALLGMLLFGVGLTYPLVRRGGEWTRDLATLVAGVVSVAYAAWLFAGMEGINPLAPLFGG